MSSSMPQAEALPWFWAAAPMLRPSLWLLRDGALIELVSGGAAQGDAAVLSAMRLAGAANGSAGAMRTARDAAARLWRIKGRVMADGSQLWQAEALEQSRALLFDELRRALAGMLVSPIRHELSGAVQNISANAEIAVRYLEKGDGHERAVAKIELIRRRLLDLHARQAATLDLWLSRPAEMQPPVALRAVLEAAADLLRGHLAVAGAQLVVDNLPALDGVMLDRAAGSVAIGILALLLLLGLQSARQQGARKLAVVVNVLPSGRPRLELRCGFCREALPELAGMEGAAVLAAIALLLDGGGLELSHLGDDGVIHLLPIPCATDGSN